MVLVGVCTGLVYPLKQVTSVSSLGVVYLLGVVVVSAYWGLWLGVAMSVLSAAAFNFFHLPPVGRFTIADSRNWVALGTFLAVAVATSYVSELARARAVEAQRRGREADLTAEIARVLLARAGVEDALVPIGRRLAAVFELPWASITLREVDGDVRREPIALRVGERRLGTLVIPAGLRPSVVDRLRERAVPALAAVLDVGQVARLEAVLRRASPDPEEAVISAAGLEVDLAARVVRRDGEEIHLTRTEFELLRVLVRNRGRLMTHRALLSDVWGPEYADDVTVLRGQIANLRRKIEPGGGVRRHYIRTDSGVGYRFDPK